MAPNQKFPDAPKLRPRSIITLAILCLLASTPLPAQQRSQQQAHALVAVTIQALGGPAWLNVRTARSHIRMALYFQGAPTGDTLTATESVELPDKKRLDISKQHVIQIFSGSNVWEITYKGKRKIPAEKLAEAQRIKNHSLAVVLREWYSNPSTVLIDEGPSQVNRRPTEKITLINPANDAVTLEIDAEAHLPLRLYYEWRDPRFHDKTLEATEYDNYHTVDGIATPYTVTQTRNGEVFRQEYMLDIAYNVLLPKDFFNPDVAAAHLK